VTGVHLRRSLYQTVEVPAKPMPTKGDGGVQENPNSRPGTRAQCPANGPIHGSQGNAGSPQDSQPPSLRRYQSREQYHLDIPAEVNGRTKEETAACRGHPTEATKHGRRYTSKGNRKGRGNNTAATQPGRNQTPNPQKALAAWVSLEWKRRWRHNAAGQQATTWKAEWTQAVHQLYDGLCKHEAKALFILRTEVLGLNDWLASIGVTDVDKRCGCGWPSQTVRHILLFCPIYTASRAHFFQRT